MNLNEKINITNIMDHSDIFTLVFSDKKYKSIFVENLIDTAVIIIETIWTNSHADGSIVSLRLFLQELLRRSRTSYSTLLVALLYLIRLKTTIKHYQRSESSQCRNINPVVCGKRMFLAGVIVASKFIQDGNYSNQSWSKLSGLSIGEINANEILFLELINYKLFVAEDLFKCWNSLLIRKIQAISGSGFLDLDTFSKPENQEKILRFREFLKSLNSEEELMNIIS